MEDMYSFWQLDRDVPPCPDCKQIECICDEDEICTCDIDGEENCPAHYPIDDGSDDDEDWADQLAAEAIAEDAAENLEEK